MTTSTGNPRVSTIPDGPPPFIDSVRPGQRLALHRLPADGARVAPGAPGVLFCGGFHSSMRGDKARALEVRCRERGHAFTRFDYRGHGESDGEPAAFHPGDWRDDVLTVLDADVALDGRRRIVVGSSMGAWLAVRAAIERPAAVAGLLLIAAAPDFTHELLPGRLGASRRAALEAGEAVRLESGHGDPPYPITPRLIDGGRAVSVLDGSASAVACPVRLLHGTADETIPIRWSERLRDAIGRDRASLERIEGGDHRLSDAASLARMSAALETLIDIDEVARAGTARAGTAPDRR